jgi:hypothetical protein
MQSLIFFNKEGDNLNFRWNESNEKWEGDFIFHENSNDTFKTIGLYLFEKIPSFEYEMPPYLKLDKFQLFNEYKFSITGNIYMTQSVSYIEPSNKDTQFYSKWIHGENFESKYPVGSQIIFNQDIFEFTSINISYTVVQKKKNAILIISSLNNNQFDNLYGAQIGLTTSYQNITISGVNSIGVYNYVDSNLENLLSSWSEPDFYSKYFNDRKITLINTEKNDGVYTINNIDLFDKSYYKYELDKNTFTQSQDLIIELITKTDLPIIYSGGLSLHDNIINFSDDIPKILKPGAEIVIPSSVVNQNNIIIGSIPTFLGNTNLTYYPIDSQVLWENNIYQCIQSHTWSGTSSITPGSASYWSPSPNYLPVNNTLTTESLSVAEIYLTTNKLYYTQTFTQSGNTTLQAIANRYADDFKFFNIDLYHKDYKIHADLIYPSLYAEVNFYPGIIGSFSYGTTNIINEQNVGILETLIPENNTNTNTNFVYNIVFTDLDEFGVKIKINGQEYQEQIDWIYVGLTVNLQRTIDRTLRNWLVRNYTRLYTLGIIANLQYIGNNSSIYYNSIILKTEYPNVPLQFTVEVGTTADFYIEHSDVIFSDMSNYLSININGKNYDQVITLNSNIPDINGGLENWVNEYSSELDDYGIYVSNINSMLKFRIKEQNKRLDYIIKTGKSDIIGTKQYKVINKIKGNFGALISSNEITLPKGETYSFEENPFATGQIVAVNNTPRPYDNQEYNILYLGPNDLVLSYQGPFWGTTDPRCDVSPFVSIAFNGGFGATGCLPIITPPVIQYGGNFDLTDFSYAFSLRYASTNDYSVSDYTLDGNDNIIDILHLQLTGHMYVLGDNLTAIDSALSIITDTIILTGNTSSSICIKYNPINNYLYCLTTTKIYVVDPIINTLISIITPGYVMYNMEINNANGDVYITHTTNVSIWLYTNLTNTASSVISTSGNVLNMAYNEGENDMYIIQDDDNLIKIDGVLKSIQSTYNINGLTNSIFYEPINSSIYVFDSNNLISINDGVTQSITSIITSNNSYMVFNNISGNISISQDTLYTNLSLNNELISSLLVANYGHLTINQYDGDIYMSSKNSNQVLVIDTVNSSIKHNESFSSNVLKTIYNPDRQSIFGIQPSSNTLVEISVTLNSEIIINSSTYSNVYENFYGTLDADYTPHTDLWLKTREYIRRPRENYNNDPFVKYVWKWETDQTPQMFLYDFSGTQLTTSGSYSYIGQKPLELISLNRKPNKNIDRISLPEFQQTIFDEIVETLDHIDSETNLSIIPEPMQTFIGFKSDDEGPITSKLILYKREDISFTLSTSLSNNNIIEFKLMDGYGIISLDVSSSSIFTTDEDDNTRGLRTGQLLKIYISDITNVKNKYISFNHGKTFKIRKVYTRFIIVDFINDTLVNELSKINDYPSTSKITYLSVKFKVIDKEIGRFNVSGQTEIEDVRYKIELSNSGQNIQPDDIFIFKSYDINEQGVDWGFLNKKRKEMLMVRHDIFPFVGSYKSIINAINYFGYNDLELYEYYRNININSPEFFKLLKVEIPDIFDNTTEGWTVNDFIKHTMPNPNYEDTNLFNLTYKITDKDGNNIQMYSLSEVILKLQRLKYWLQKNVIPITHKILDITGRADFVGNDYITHKNFDTKILNVKQNMTPIDFKLNEAYLMPINSGSTVYTCHIDFYNATASIIEPDYFSVKIRTYKTYKEWNPFTTYNYDDKVIYYGKIYTSVINSNKLNNPRKYEDVPLWSQNNDYKLGQIINYNNIIYQYIGTQSSFQSYGTSSNTISPYYDILTNNSFSKWVDITYWKNINYVPVQYITEYRTEKHPFNFTIDSNIDPFITIEVTSDNGYGQIYTSKKNYEIRGSNDLYTGFVGDSISPFEPIIQITSPTVSLPTV